MPIFDRIVLLESISPRGAAFQMAVDELLLKAGSGAEAGSVLLRCYQWDRPSVSIGYFGEQASLSSDFLAGRPLVRRPTGGGTVEHGGGQDFTYSVIVGAAIARQIGFAPRRSYREIHRCLAAAMRAAGLDVQVAGASEVRGGGDQCFVNPVGDDLMLAGKKIAGAGQKRSRGAILHQGSVQPAELSEGFEMSLAKSLAGEVELRGLPDSMQTEAEELAQSKYSSDEWNLRR